MKTVSKYWSMACMAMLIGGATGCTSDGILNNDDQASAGQVKMDTISVTMETAGTRVAYDDTQLKLTWKTGDQINVLAVTAQGFKKEVYTLIGNGGSITGAFTGKAIEGASKYTAGFPLNYTADTGKYIFDMNTQEQDGNNNTKHLNSFLFSATGELYSTLERITFISHVAILKFHFTNLPTDIGELKSITWSSSQNNVFYVSKTASQSDPITASEISLKLKNIAISSGKQEVTAYLALTFNSTKNKYNTTISSGSVLRATVTGTNGKSYYAEATLTKDILYETGKRYTAEMDGTNPMAWTPVTN